MQLQGKADMAILGTVQVVPVTTVESMHFDISHSMLKVYISAIVPTEFGRVSLPHARREQMLQDRNRPVRLMSDVDSQGRLVRTFMNSVMLSTHIQYGSWCWRLRKGAMHMHVSDCSYIAAATL